MAHYETDDRGQVWKVWGKKPTRTKAEERRCNICGKTFYEVPSRKTVTCSRSCGMKLTHRGGEPHTVTKPVSPRSGENSPRWKGGRIIDKNGYVKVYTGEHHPSGARKYRLEHRIVMEQQLGRPLKRHEIVHHKDGNRQNNDPSNLEIWSKAHPPGQRDRHCPTCTCGC